MSAAAQTCAPRADGYARREPEATLLYRLVQEHWPTFLERAEAQLAAMAEKKEPDEAARAELLTALLDLEDLFDVFDTTSR